MCSNREAAFTFTFATILVSTIFEGGAFVRFDLVPGYWLWLMNLSLFTHATRASLIAVMEHRTYRCALSNMSDGEGSAGICLGPLYERFPCKSAPLPSDTTCDVAGVDVMTAISGIRAGESKWAPFLYLVVIGIALRLAQLVFLYCPLAVTASVILRLRQSKRYARVRPRHGPRKSSIGMIRVVVKPKESVVGHDEQPNIAEKSRSDHDCEEGRGRRQGPNAIDTVNMPSLVWRRLNAFRKSDDKQLLENVSGMARSGRLLAIMGPSGAGKTTLIQIISNRATYVRATGDVRYCGRSLLSKDLMYVPKAVELNGLLTVQEHIELVGCLRGGSLFGLRARIDGVCDTLKLTDKLHMKCCELSAGEVKQVGVCIGMVVDPRILVLDEPTSGLDSYTAQTIVSQLLKLARDNEVVVVMSIHQPSTALFNSLEDLMLLEGGRMAYYGPLSDAKRFFDALGHPCPSVFSPADFYVELIYRKPFDDLDVTWKDLYLSFNIAGLITAKHGEEVIEPNADVEDLRRRFRQSLYYLIQYFWGLYYKDIRFYWVRITFMLSQGIYLGTLYLQMHREVQDIRRIFGAISWMVFMGVLCGVFATTALCDERKFAAEMVKNGVFTPLTYCIAQFITSLPCNLLSSLVFNSIFHWLFVSGDATVFVHSVLALFLELLFIDSLFLVTVEVFRVPLLCLTINVLIMAPLSFLSGFSVNVSDIKNWLSWVCYLIPTKVSQRMYSSDSLREFLRI